MRAEGPLPATGQRLVRDGAIVTLSRDRASTDDYSVNRRRRIARHIQSASSQACLQSEESPALKISSASRLRPFVRMTPRSGEEAIDGMEENHCDDLFDLMRSQPENLWTISEMEEGHLSRSNPMPRSGRWQGFGRDAVHLSGLKLRKYKTLSVLFLFVLQATDSLLCFFGEYTQRKAAGGEGNARWNFRKILYL